MTAYLSDLRLDSPFARFLLTGGSATLFNLCLLWLLVHQLGIWYLVACVLSYSVCIAYNFALQRAWAFNGGGGSIMEQLPKFVGVNLLGLLFNTAMLYALAGFLRLPVIFSQAISALAMSILSYFAYGRLFLRPPLPNSAFGPRQPEHILKVARNLLMQPESP